LAASFLSVFIVWSSSSNVLISVFCFSNYARDSALSWCKEAISSTSSDCSSEIIWISLCNSRRVASRCWISFVSPAFSAELLSILFLVIFNSSRQALSSYFIVSNSISSYFDLFLLSSSSF
jgi:hypothetical protein